MEKLTDKQQTSIGKFEDSLEKKAKNTILGRRYINIPQENFNKQFNLIAEILVKRRTPENNFVITKKQIALRQQLFYWATGNEKFDGILSKGIMLAGNHGTGKTLMLESLSALINHYMNLGVYQIKKINAYDMEQIIEDRDIHGKSNGINYTQQSLFIDEIGWESKTVMSFGTEKMPFFEIINARYNAGVYNCIATTNYKIDTLEEMYSEFISDRLKEMFNFMTLLDKNFRL